MTLPKIHTITFKHPMQFSPMILMTLTIILIIPRNSTINSLGTITVATWMTKSTTMKIMRTFMMTMTVRMIFGRTLMLITSTVTLESINKLSKKLCMRPSKGGESRLNCKKR